MEDTAVDFVLEKLMELINSEFILVYEEERHMRKQRERHMRKQPFIWKMEWIEEEERPTKKQQILRQMEWIYEEMQFLRKFLKDYSCNNNQHTYTYTYSEVVVAKIRDVIGKVQHLLDLFLNFPVQHSMKTIKAGHGFPFFLKLDNVINKIKSCKEEVMNLDVLIEPIVDLAKRIHEGFTPLVEDICCIKEEASKEFPRFHYEADQFFTCIMIFDEFCRLHSLSGRVLHVLMTTLTRPDFCDYLLISNMFKYVVHLADRICHPSRSDFSWLNLSFLWQCTEKRLDVYVRVVEDIRSFMTSIMMDFKEKGFDLSHVEYLVIDDISQGFGSVTEEIESIKTHVMEIYGFGVPQIGNGASVRAPKPIIEQEIMVGFHDERSTIIKLLIGEHDKQLKVIPIVGMPGIGKTTLAGEVYNDPYIKDLFSNRAWTCVSQVYRKRDLLLGILCSALYLRDQISELDDEKLGEQLYKCLKGKRYLIVMDDIWNIRAWDDLKKYFPNDQNGSRIMFTSRLLDVALHAMPHHLRFLNEDESWDLLQQRVFQKESCPPELMKIGKRIAKKCRGLPLAIVVIAGLLAKNVKTVDWWRHVARSVSSYIVSDPEQYMDTLALSYNHLPHHLKSCFLYFSAFPEDCEIPVQKLVWLWIAEGFIHQIGGKSLEDVAEDYLLDLIDRSLVLVGRRRYSGGIKACCVHDLLHDLCLRKAKEENFLQQIDGYEEVSSSSCNVVKRRLCIRSRNFHRISSELFAPHIRSFLCFGFEHSPIPPKDMSFLEQRFKLLRVLDLSTITVSTFSFLIIRLVFLRYLALRGNELELPYDISKLQNLETLIVSKVGSTDLPTTIWNMVKLRHLCIGGENVIRMVGNPFVLNNLQTISQVCPSTECQKVLARAPNLQKLVLCATYQTTHKGFWFPDLDFLNHLKILKFFNRYIPRNHTYNLQGVKFPPNLKELTLSNTALGWKEMSIIGSLLNLESLKLEFQACVGPQWETIDGGFCRLKFLRFYYMNIEQWNASNNHFPVLERLVLHRCEKLQEIPFEFGDIDTLQMIEVSCCSNSAINSARQIQEEQQNMGNDFLKILIVNPPDWELTLEAVLSFDECWHNISVSVTLS